MAATASRGRRLPVGVTPDPVERMPSAPSLLNATSTQRKTRSDTALPPPGQFEFSRDAALLICLSATGSYFRISERTKNASDSQVTQRHQRNDLNKAPFTWHIATEARNREPRFRHATCRYLQS